MLLLSLVLMAGIVFIVYNRSCPCDHTKENKEKLTPENSIIIFDLHGVLFHHQYGTMVKTFLQSKDKWCLIGILIKPCLWWRVVTNIMCSRSMAQALYTHIGHEHPRAQRAQSLLIAIANCQSPDPDMINLVHTLKDHGFQLGLLSNIQEQVFAHLYPLYQELFELFDVITVSQEQMSYASKPSAKIYEYFIAQIDDEKNKIFIDDKKRNICSSLPFGMIGYHYRSYDALKERLRQLGIKL